MPARYWFERELHGLRAPAARRCASTAACCSRMRSADELRPRPAGRRSARSGGRSRRPGRRSARAAATAAVRSAAVEQRLGRGGAERPDAVGDAEQRAERVAGDSRSSAGQRDVGVDRPRPATPICAFCCCHRAARPRRCRAGAPAGSTARPAARPARRRQRRRRRSSARPARLPISTAIACSNCARCTPTLISLRLRAVSSWVCAVITSARAGDAGVVLVLRDLQRRASIVGDRVGRAGAASSSAARSSK